MNSIKIYVEGGGETNAAGRGELRVGFDALMSAQKDAARKKRIKWDTVFCGGRSEAADEFAKAVRRNDAKFIVLVVDAEDEVFSENPPHPTPEERVRHLVQRDGWTQHLESAPSDQIHLMNRCMEAWVFADAERVASFYQRDFRADKLPKRTVLDEEPKPALYAAIEAATKGTQKGRYGKVKHASALLKIVRPSKIAERCVSFRQFAEWLDDTIAGA